MDKMEIKMDAQIGSADLNEGMSGDFRAEQLSSIENKIKEMQRNLFSEEQIKEVGEKYPDYDVVVMDPQYERIDVTAAKMINLM